MLSVYKLKPAFQRSLKPLLKLSARCGISPNHITVAALALSGLGGVMVSLGGDYPVFLLTLPAILLIRMALNALDGMMAREYNQASRLGEILNEVGDVLSDVLLYLPFMVLFYDSLPTVLLIAVFAVLSCLNEFCGILSKAMTGIRRYDGPMGKSDRALAMSIVAILLYFMPHIMHPLSPSVFALLNGLLAWSCLKRLQFILKKGEETFDA